MKKQRRRPMAEINVVPYIDVMLVLLVIFMITAPLLSQGVQVDLPKAAARPMATQEKGPLIVSVNAAGQYFLNDWEHPSQAIDANTLTARVAAALQVAESIHQPRSVLVKGDEHVNYGAVVSAMVLLQHAGAPSVGLMTRDS